MGDCYVPSSLLDWVHEELPFFDANFNNTGQTAEDLVDNLGQGVNSFYDYFLRAAIWGGVVFLVGLPFPVLTCVCYCWACYCCSTRICSCGGGDGGRSKWGKFIKIVCGVLVVAFTIANVSLSGFGLWAEEQFDREFWDNFEEVQSLLNNVSSLSSPNGANSSTRNSLESLSSSQTSTEDVLLICFALLLLPLLAVLVGVIVATLCKRSLAMIIALILLMFTTLVLVPCLGVGVFFLILYSDVCVGLQHKQLNNTTHECLPQLEDYTDTLESFCSNAYMSFVMMVLAAAGSILAHYCLQLSGTCFASLFTGHKRSVQITPVDDQRDHELQQLSRSPSPPPNSPVPPDTEEADTAILLSYMEQESLSPASEDSQSQDPLPSAPPPDPSLPEEPSIIEYQDNPTTV